MQKEQLTNLLSESEAMTQQLLLLRNCIISNSICSNYPQSAETVMKGIRHRSHLRTLAETLEANRNLVQVKKQKIERSRIVLEGLDYFKKTLKDKIQSFDTQVDFIDDYLEEPVGPIDWENDYEAGERRLKASLQKLKSKDEVYRTSVHKKNELVKTMSEKNKLYNLVMPKQIKKLTEQVQEVSRMFGIEASELLQKIESSHLAYIYDSFKTLKVAEKIDVKYNKEEHQIVDLILKPTGLQFYQRSMQLGIKIQQKQLKVKICHLKPEVCKLVLGVDRRSDFSNRDIFHRLINREDIKPVIEEPSNESQRNLNNKFICASWLENALCVSSTKCAYFLSSLRMRAFSVSLIKHLFDTLKNPSWLSAIAPPLYNEFTLKRFLVESVQKIGFSDYRQMVSLSSVLKRSLNQYEAKLRKDLSEQQEHKLREEKNNLYNLLSTKGLEQLLIPDVYNYYKVSVSYRGLRVLFVSMIPFEYPEIAPKMKVISLERSMDQEMGPHLPASLEHCKLNSKATLNREKLELERDQSSSCSLMNQAPISDPFKLVYLLSKFLTSVYAIQNSFIQGQKCPVPRSHT